MGFFKKIFKGIGKVFKKIGKGIKRAFKKFGKFMGKIGVLGQVAMMFILPGVGQLLGKAWSAIAGKTATQAAAQAASTTASNAAIAAGETAKAAATKGAQAAAAKTAVIKAGGKAATEALAGFKSTGLMASSGTLGQGVGKMMQFTGKVVGTPGKIFSNITQGVTETLGNFAKTASNKLFGTDMNAASKFFGSGDSAFGRSFGTTSRFQNLTRSDALITGAQNQAIAAPTLNIPTNERLGPITEFQGPKVLTSEQVRQLPVNTTEVTSKFNNLSKAEIKEIYGNASEGISVTTDPTAKVSTDPNLTSKFDNLSAKEIRETLGQSGKISSDLQDSFERAFRNPDGTFANQNVINVEPASNQLGSTSAQTLMPDGAMENLTPIDKVGKQSLLSRATGAITDTFSNIRKGPSNVMDNIETFAADPVGETGKYLFSGTQKAVQQGVNNQLLRGIGLVDDPVEPVYKTTQTYVAPFETSTPQMFEAPETMSPMAFAQNVTNNPSPYGYTAFQYNQYMNRTAAA